MYAASVNGKAVFNKANINRMCTELLFVQPAATVDFLKTAVVKMNIYCVYSLRQLGFRQMH